MADEFPQKSTYFAREHDTLDTHLGAPVKLPEFWLAGSTAAGAPATPAGEAHIGEVGGRLVFVTKEQTRPANTTAYTAGDVWSNGTTVALDFPGMARVSGGSGYITGAKLTLDQTTQVPRFRVHIWNANDATYAADNAPRTQIYTELAKYIGWFDLPAMITPAGTSTISIAEDMTIRIPYVCVATTLWATLEVLDAYTPSSGGKASLTLWGDIN